MPPTIVFIRHGETDWNVEGRLQGSRDIPLNEKGRAQALRNGDKVANAMPEAAGYDFVASPLIRSRETMEIVRKAMGLDPLSYILDDRLREIVYGDWEGFTNEELEARQPDLIAERHRDKWRFLPPNGESYQILSERVGDWLKAVGRPTFVVSHGGVGRVLRKLLLGWDPTTAITTDFPQDKVLVFRDGVADWI